MHTLFPDELDTPAGLVTKRTILQLPPWAALTVVTLVGGPLLFVSKLGWRALIVSALGIGVGVVIAKAAKDDPQFVTAWLGELLLEAWYE